MPKLNVMLNFYYENDSDRRKELEYCLISHLTNPEVDTVSIIIKKLDEDYIKSLDTENKTFRYFFDGRATYNHFFRISADFSGCVNLICNADIFLDEKSAALLKCFSWNLNTVMALSRWDLIDFPITGKDYQATLFNREDSQDTWVFKGSLPYFSKANFSIGIPGCDNSIAFVLKNSGYEVINPALDFQTYHLHLSKVRSYEIGKPHTKVSPPYLYLPVCSINKIPSKNILYHFFYCRLQMAFSFLVGKVKRTYYVHWDV